MDRTRLPPAAGLTALAVTALIALTGCNPTAASSATASGAPVAAGTAASPDRAAGTPSRSPSPGPTPSRPPAVPATLRVGTSGPDVQQLQQQLTALGYWAGPLDGVFGGVTEQAVFALQKAAGLSPSGVVTAATRTALANGVRPRARSTTGRLIEVDLSRGLLLFVTGGHVDYALNTSTGGGYVYYENGQRNVAITPKGRFTTYRVVDGPDRSPLGLLIRPRYFTGGYAIHGDDYVPARPVSHGCVRVTAAAINWIWAMNLDPIGTTVWVY